MTTKPLAGLRLGIFGKGGCGKSTLTVLLAEALREAGYAVVILDADSTNVGLAAALGLDRQPRPLLDHFGGMVFSGGRVTCPVDDPTPLADAEISLAELPREYVGRNQEGIALLVAGKLGALGPGAGCDGPIAKIARDLRLRDAGPADVLLIDYKAGFEDSARGALTSLDWALTVVDPTTAAVQMAIHLAHMVEAIRAGVPPATRHLEDPRLAELAVERFRNSPIRGSVAVLNRIRDAATERFLAARLEAEAVPVLGSLAEDAAIQKQWLLGRRIRSNLLLAGARQVMRRLEETQERAVVAAARAGHDAAPATSGAGR